ncbi:hypothetical protein RND71_034194 [Anisodus tanguticus]|uniref:Uncharacterized protein n=1 Tax=Anisodus tanguticus TaxID=243964 RepID=A0AAE1R958_9SOLA|nr:hypothetical protein RND71_034194 [Anisodus tanguticus]
MDDIEGDQFSHHNVEKGNESDNILNEEKVMKEGNGVEFKENGAIMLNYYTE